MTITFLCKSFNILIFQNSSFLINIIWSTIPSAPIIETTLKLTHGLLDWVRTVKYYSNVNDGICIDTK